MIVITIAIAFGVTHKIVTAKGVWFGALGLCSMGYASFDRCSSQQMLLGQVSAFCEGC